MISILSLSLGVFLLAFLYFVKSRLRTTTEILGDEAEEEEEEEDLALELGEVGDVV